MKVSSFICLMSFILSCQTKHNNSNHSENEIRDIPTRRSETFFSKNDTIRVILKTNTIPGNINISEIGKLSEPLKALAAFYSAMGGTLCNGETCELTTALGLGKQGTQKHKALISTYFPNDKVAGTVLKQDCYLRPSGASTFSEFEYLNFINLGDTVKVVYNLYYYNRGTETWTEGPDIYSFYNNEFVKQERNLWKQSDK